MAPVISWLVFFLVSPIAFALPGDIQALSPRRSHTKTSPAPPQKDSKKILLPAIHWDHDLSDLKNLIPQESSALYYAETSGFQNPSLKHMYLHMKVNFTNPTVVLEHSEYVSKVKCDSAINGLEITLDNNKAWQTVKKHWAGLDNLVLLTYADGCKASSNNSRTYWLTSSASFVDAAVGGIAKVVGKKLLISDGLTDVDLVWGTHHAAPKSSVASNSSTLTTRANHKSKPKHHHKPQCRPKSDVLHGLAAQNWCKPNFDSRLDREIGSKSVALSVLDHLENVATEITSLGKHRHTKRFAAPSDSSSSSSSDSSDSSSSDSSSDSSSSSSSDSSSSSSSDSSSDSSSSSSSDSSSSSSSDSSSSSSKGSSVTFVSSSGDSETFYESSYNEICVRKCNLGDSFSYSFSEGPPADELTNDPWQNSYELFKYPSDDDGSSDDGSSNEKRADDKGGDDGGGLDASVALYCVDCGVSGGFEIGGRARFTTVFPTHFWDLEIDLSGQLAAAFELGLVAGIEYQKTVTKNLAVVSFAGFGIPEIIEVGPTLTVQASAGIDISAQGKILAGIKMQYGPFKAVSNLLDSSKSSATGFDASITRIFEASGEIDIKATIGIPIELGVDLSIPLADYSDGINLVDTPGIEAEGKFEIGTGGSSNSDSDCSNGPSSASSGGSNASNGGSNSGSGSSSSSSSPSSDVGHCNNGISWDIRATNDVGLDLFGDEISLYSWKSKPFAQGCYKLFGGSSSSNSSCSSSGSGSGSSGSGSGSSGSGSGSSGSGSGSSDSGNGSSGSSSGSSGSGSGSSGSGSGSSGSGSGSSGSGSGSSGSGSSGSGNSSSGQSSSGQNSTSPSSTSQSSKSQSSNSQSSNSGSSSVNQTTITAGTHGSHSLYASPDGNFYYDTSSHIATLFAVDSHLTVVSDMEKRYFHFYKDSMRKYGVSRMRLSTLEKVPKTAGMFVLQPLNTDGDTATPDEYVAVDKNAHTYFPMVCRIDGQMPKFFLVENIEKAAHTLKRRELLWTVTGGDVKGCSYVPLVSKIGPKTGHAKSSKLDSFWA